CRAGLVRGSGSPILQTEEVMEPPLGVLQDLVSLVKFREVARTLGGHRIGMGFQRFAVINLLQPSRVKPRYAWLLKQRKVIGHAAKLSPQEQCATAFGFVTLKPPFCRSSL